MSPILIPTKSPEDWKRLLAQPDLHWKPGSGYSAMTLARAWEAARDNGLPPEVLNILQTGLPDAETLRLLVSRINGVRSLQAVRELNRPSDTILRVVVIVLYCQYIV